MKGAEVFFVLVLIAGGVALFAFACRATWQLGRDLYRHWRRDHRPPWEIREESDGELVEVLAVSGEERLLIGAAPFASSDFEDQLYELRAAGREKVYALNEGRRG